MVPGRGTCGELLPSEALAGRKRSETQFLLDRRPALERSPAPTLILA